MVKGKTGLKVSEEKSRVVDVRKKATEFLGFSLKAKKKRNKWIVKSHVSRKGQDQIKEKIRKEIKKIQRHPTTKTIYGYNKVVAGIQNYYYKATEVSEDFSRINYEISKSQRTRYRKKSKEYQERYGGSKYSFNVLETALYPIYYARTKPSMLYSKERNNYTKEGREKIHKEIGSIDKEILSYLSKNPVISRSVEYNDNRLSLYTAQKGKCGITGESYRW